MIRRRRVPIHLRHLAASLLLAGMVIPWNPPPALADEPGPGQTRAAYDARVRESKSRARELRSEGARQRLLAARRHAALVREARRRGLAAPAPGSRLRPAPLDEDAALAGRPARGTSQSPSLGALSGATIPANVRANSLSGDLSNTAQSEQCIAALGNNVLVAWNDGIGPHYQGYGYSTDGGQTFSDGGAPPALGGWIWASDPVVAVNEKTGTFYYCGLVSPAGFNGIAIVPATFSGAALVWGAPVLVRSEDNNVAFLDKQWMVADSTTGNLYLTYSTFDFPTGVHIDFQRSTNGGASWSAVTQISSGTDNGAVQGSRPVVGPGGELYATWSALGSGPQDYIRVRRSTTQGLSWGTEATPVSLYINFGTGAPGFNRDRGVDFPSIAVDRTTGPNRGRVHLAWTESVNKYDDPLNALGPLVEAEHNGFFRRANPFAPGQVLRGAFGTAGDVDYFSFTAIQGTDYMFECDSIPDPFYSFRVLCGQDTVAALRLAYTGDARDPPGGRGYIIWSAPATGTTYLRMLDLSGVLGGYRISTGIVGVGAERGRDSRDVFACHSDNGVAWSTPVRVNDASPYYDEYLPEVLVGADGTPYVTWFDWRDDGCGGRSHQYLSRSLDGGDAWAANQRFSEVQNNWTSIQSNLAPNQGDYSHLYADVRYLRPAWADGRGGSPDVYTARIDTWHQITGRQAAVAADPATVVGTSWTVRNLNPLFGNTYNYTMNDQRGWPMPAPGAVAVGADASGVINLNVAVPDTVALGVNQVCLTLTNAKGTLSQSCCFDLTVQTPGTLPPPPPPALDLSPSVPNPATDQTRIDYSLPVSGPVTLRLFGLNGDRVRTLVDGDRPAGPNSVLWDGRDDAGRPVAAGTYFYRLEGFGQSRVRRLTWIR